MKQVQIPVRETSRLKLVPLTESFSEGIYDLFSHSEVCRYCSKAIDKYGNRIDLPVTTRSESNKIIDFFLDYSERGEGFRWAVITKEDEEFVGAVGFNSLGKVSELAYHQLPRYWGNGFMSEASACALEWIRGKFGCEYVVAFIESGNESSVRLAKRLGFLSSHEEREGAERYQLDLTQPFQPVAGGDATRWRSSRTSALTLCDFVKNIMNKAKPVILILSILLGIAISPDKVLAKSSASTNSNLLLLPSMSFSVDTANYKIGFSIEDTLHLKSVEVVEILTEKVKVFEINRKVKVSRFGFVRLLDFVGVGGDPVMDSDIPVIDIRKECIVFRDTKPETKISFKELFNEGLKEECVDSDKAGYLNAVEINANDQKDAWIQVFLWLSRNVPEWTYCQGNTADGDICLSKASGYLDGRLFDIQCIVLPGNKHTKFYFDITSAFMDKTQPVAGGDATR